MPYSYVMEMFLSLTLLHGVSFMLLLPKQVVQQAAAIHGLPWLVQVKWVHANASKLKLSHNASSGFIYNPEQPETLRTLPWGGHVVWKQHTKQCVCVSAGLY